MKYHALLYHDSIPGPWNNNRTYKIPACGTNSYVSIDGRLSRDNAIEEAFRTFRRRYPNGPLSFTLHRTDSIRSCHSGTIIYRHNLTIQETKET